MLHAGRTAGALGLVLLSGLLACSARSKVVAVDPLEGSLASYTDVVVAVESRVSEDVAKEMSDLEGLTVAKIKALASFKTVQVQNPAADPPAKPATASAKASPAAAKPKATPPKAASPRPSDKVLLVKLAVTDAKKVGGNKRFMLGAFAGRARMTTEISFVHARTGKVLGTYMVTGESGGSGFSGGTSDAVQKAATAAGDLVAQNFTKAK